MLSISHARGAVLPCGAGTGCDELAFHPSSYFHGIPVAYFGLAAYALIATLTSVRCWSTNTTIRHWSFVMTYFAAALGVAVSLRLTAVAVVLVGVVCAWCIASGVVMCLLLWTHASEAAGSARRGAVRESAPSKPLVTVCVVIVAGALATHGLMLGTRATLQLDERELATIPLGELVPAHAPVLGRGEAPWTLVVFSDLGCAACHFYLPQAVQLVKRFPQLKIVYRHYPLASGGPSDYAAQLVAGIGDSSAAWRFILECSTRRPKTADEYKAVLFGIVGGRRVLTRGGADAERAAVTVRKDAAVGQRLRLPGTPTFILVHPGGVRREAVSLDALPGILSRAQRAKASALGPIKHGKRRTKNEGPS